MRTTDYNISLDPQIKQQAEEIFADFGLKLSDAINVFLHKSIMHYGFPFDVRYPSPKADLLEAIQESEQIIEEIKAGKREGYTDVSKFLRDILDEGDDDEVHR